MYTLKLIHDTPDIADILLVESEKHGLQVTTRKCSQLSD